MKTAAKKNKRPGLRSVTGKSKKTTSALRSSSRTRALKAKREKTKIPSAPRKKSAQLPSHEDALKKLFNDLLKDTLNAEKQLVKALPRLAAASTSKQLSTAFKKHLSETEKHVRRLEKVFSVCDLKVAGKKCEAMEGLILEGKTAINETPKGSLVRDVALIVVAQKVEHYEIAAYRSLRSIAEVCGFDKAIDLLQQTLDEEGETDKKLTAISQSLNPKASAKAKTDVSGVVEEAVYMTDESKKEDEEDDDDDLYEEVDEEEEGEPNTSGFGNTL